MAINVNQPSFISFLENLTNNILSHVTVDNYFALNQESKLSVQYVVMKLIKTSIKLKLAATEEELKGFVVVLRKKNEESEHYEFAEILNDIIKNFDVVNDVTKPVKKETTVKSEKQPKKS